MTRGDTVIVVSARSAWRGHVGVLEDFTREGQLLVRLDGSLREFDPQEVDYFSIRLVGVARPLPVPEPRSGAPRSDADAEYPPRSSQRRWVRVTPWEGWSPDTASPAVDC
jgi:hypothetical protein